MTANEYLTAQMSELRWLVSELGHEVQALSTTPYPHVHRLLVQSLATKIAQVAEAPCESVSPIPLPVNPCCASSASLPSH
jgi:hypothetical protein